MDVRDLEEEDIVITLYVERTLMLNGSFIVCSSRLSPFTIMEANDAKSQNCSFSNRARAY